MQYRVHKTRVIFRNNNTLREILMILRLLLEIAKLLFDDPQQCSQVYVLT